MLRPIALILISIQFLALQSKAQVRQLYLDTSYENHLYKISFYSPNNGFFAFRRWIGSTSDSGRTFTKKYIDIGNVDYNGYPVNLTFGFEVSGVKAFSQDTIIVWGDYGLVPTILYSKDGGNHFKVVFWSQFAPIPNSWVADMIFPQDHLVGYAVDADRILKSVDGGLNWMVSFTQADSRFLHLDGIDNSNVFAFSSQVRTLLKTSNAGATWQQMPIPSVPPSSNILGVSFINTAKGWLNMSSGGVYFTSDGGTNWSLKNDFGITGLKSNVFKFVNDSTGYAV